MNIEVIEVTDINKLLSPGLRYRAQRTEPHTPGLICRHS